MKIQKRSVLYSCNKMIVAMICFFVLLPLIDPITTKAAEEKTVRVGYVWSTNFSEGNSDDEYKSGYAYEYLQKLTYYTGWNYEYVYGDWATMLDMLSNGEVDLMAGVSYTKERAQKMSFPDYPMGEEEYYIYVSQNSDLASSDIEGLQGLTIGCTEGSMQNMLLEQWKKERDFPCTIKPFSGNIEMYDAFNNHQIEAVVDTDIAILPSDEMVPLVKVGSSNYYLAVAKERTDLLKELNTVLEEIDRTAPYYLQNLHNKYFQKLQ